MNTRIIRLNGAILYHQVGLDRASAIVKEVMALYLTLKSGPSDAGLIVALALAHHDDVSEECELALVYSLKLGVPIDEWHAIMKIAILMEAEKGKE